MRGSLVIGAAGWEHAGWEGWFYPEDLPPEWRLTYYGNEFSQVLVPEALWLTSQVQAPWGVWRDDVDESFRFVLEIRHPLQKGSDVLDRIGACAAVLRVQLAGVVSWCPLSEEWITMLHRVLGEARFLAQGGLPEREGLAMGERVVCARVESRQATDLPWLRELMQELERRCPEDGGCWLFIDGTPPEIKALREAVILRQLLTGGGPGGR